MDYSGNLNTSLLSESAMDHQINGAGKAVFSDQMKLDSFTVDMERFTHLTNKDATLNPRINLQRSLSRKGPQRWGGEKKMNLPIPNADNEWDNAIVSTSSPRAALAGVATPEKPMVVNVGTADHTENPQQVHHQITIVTGHVPAATTVTTTTTTTTNAATTDRRLSGKRFSFRRTSSSSWIDPRRILFFFATLSSMGTILLIYFTLSMNKLSADDSMLN